MSTLIDIINDNARINCRWLDIIQKRQIRYVLLDPIHDGLFIEQLQTSPDWITDFASEEAIIFVHQPPRYSPSD